MAKKYIDAEFLRKKVEKLDMESCISEEWSGFYYAIDSVLEVIDSLQQEQPDVDLEKEIETYFKGWYMDETDQGYILHTPDDHAGLMSVKQIARHFYELGLNARKEE